MTLKMRKFPVFVETEKGRSMKTCEICRAVAFDRIFQTSYFYRSLETKNWAGSNLSQRLILPDFFEEWLKILLSTSTMHSFIVSVGCWLLDCMLLTPILLPVSLEIFPAFSLAKRWPTSCLSVCPALLNCQQTRKLSHPDCETWRWVSELWSSSTSLFTETLFFSFIGAYG